MWLHPQVIPKPFWFCVTSHSLRSFALILVPNGEFPIFLILISCHLPEELRSPYFFKDFWCVIWGGSESVLFIISLWSYIPMPIELFVAHPSIPILQKMLCSMTFLHHFADFLCDFTVSLLVCICICNKIVSIECSWAIIWLCIEVNKCLWL
jgi:hypothetical protein